MGNTRTELINALILNYLHKKDVPVDTRELSTALDLEQYTIARMMKILLKEGRVKRLPGKGNGYRYKFTSFVIKAKGKTSNLGVPVDARFQKEHHPIDSELLKKTLDKWIKEGWQPKSITAAQTLVTTLSQLMQFQWLAVTKGMSVDQADLDFCKNKMLEAKIQADNFAGFFGSLLATDDLWDCKRQATYLLKDIDDPQAYLEYARRVSEVLQ